MTRATPGVIGAPEAVRGRAEHAHVKTHGPVGLIRAGDGGPNRHQGDTHGANDGEMRTIGVMMRAMVLESVPRSDVVGCSES